MDTDNSIPTTTQDTEGPVVFIQSFDIETTGARLHGAGKDKVFAIGSALLCVPLNGASNLRVVERRRWVLEEINPGAVQPWDAVWKDHGFEQNCWKFFWSKHAGVLNSLMTDTPAADRFQTTKSMIDSFAAYVANTERECSEKENNKLIRVYDTVGFDVTNLDVLLESHGYHALFLNRPPNDWPCSVSYLGDIYRAALSIDIAVGPTPAQTKERNRNDALALPKGLSHTHDPADDALSIAYKWVHYWKMMTGRVSR